MLSASDRKKIWFDVEFKDRFNIIAGDSATGKTYLLSLLITYLSENNIPFVHLNYNTSFDSAMSEINRIKDVEDAVILVDNADILLTRELETAICMTKAATKIFMLHSFTSVKLLPLFSPGLYKIKKDENKVISVKRIGEI